MSKYVVGITGASGSIYGIKVVEALAESGAEVEIIVTDMGRKVMEYETGILIGNWLKSFGACVRILDNHNLFSGAASGSYPVDGVVLAPCSMSKLAHIAAGITPDLLTRAADVALKQHSPLALVPRETPLSAIHLRNMLRLAECGAYIVPAMPAFYQRPENINDLADFMAGRVLDCLKVENHRYRRWGKEGK